MVAITANALDEQVEMCFQSGMQDVLIKVWLYFFLFCGVLCCCVCWLLCCFLFSFSRVVGLGA